MVVVRTTANRQLVIDVQNDCVFMEIRKKIAEKQLEDGSVVPVFYDVEEKQKDSRVVKLSRDEVIILAEALKSYVEGKEKFNSFVKRSGYAYKNGKKSEDEMLAFYHSGRTERLITLSVFNGRNGEKLILGISEKGEDGKWDKEYVIGIDPVVAGFILRRAAEKILEKQF